MTEMAVMTGEELDMHIVDFIRVHGPIVVLESPGMQNELRDIVVQSLPKEHRLRFSKEEIDRSLNRLQFMGERGIRVRSTMRASTTAAGGAILAIKLPAKCYEQRPAKTS